MQIVALATVPVPIKVYQLFLVITWTNGVVLTPSQGPAAGGTNVVLTGGSGVFESGYTSLLSGVGTPPVTVISPTSLSFVTGAGALGYSTIIVSIAGGNTLNYGYAALTHLVLLSPDTFQYVAAQGIRASQYVLEALCGFDVFLRGIGGIPNPTTPPTDSSGGGSGGGSAGSDGVPPPVPSPFSNRCANIGQTAAVTPTSQCTIDATQQDARKGPA